MAGKKIICSWSGGKDSCYALMQAIKYGHKPVALLNMLNEHGQISRSHGIPENILQAQAQAAGLPLHTVASSWRHYEEKFVDALQYLKNSYQTEAVVFGDIDLQEHRDWEEKTCALAGLTALLPLWHQNRKTLVAEMLKDNMQAMIVSCQAAMGPDFLGKYLTPELVETLEYNGIDPCGENGEFHTLITHCSMFAHPISVEMIDRFQYQNYWFAQLQKNLAH